MNLNKLKFFCIAITVLPLLAIVLSTTGEVQANITVDEEAAAATYKAKCAMCHSPKAEKFFDLTKTDEQHVEIILKGKKGEKPPYMPAYETKGVTAEQSKALVVYMRELKK